MVELGGTDSVESIPGYIRKAIRADAAALREISLKTSIGRDEQGKTGFVDFKVPEQERYEELIESDNIYVAEKDGKVVGFLSCFYSDFLAKKFEGHGDEIVDHLLKTRAGKYLYLEQLAVLGEYQKANIASDLCAGLMNDLDDGDMVWTAICLNPARNCPSIAVAQKFGAEHCENIVVYDGLTFGIFRLTIRKTKTI